MTDEGTVNSQVIDSVTNVATLMTAQAPSQAFAMLDTVMVETMGMAMYNAVNRQQNAGMVSTAAVTAACARILNTFAAIPAAPPKSESAPPASHIEPLPSPPPPVAPPLATSPDASVADAYAKGNAAISTLQTLAGSSSSVAQKAQSDLQQLASSAGAPPVPKPSNTTEAQSNTAEKPNA
ncbi:RebB family R body protein [Curvibacter sp. CHRR-16]|uniref:RebB family R body protein n=1 Tax=Curvibacter sp. CHRR-16 TaxID=2835872 RepID=UPI001BDB0EB0|nr:RebB family R body protein [Curvibacter sp. CHRR-16]MBT0569620.1 RebB family R body protein [Curvibacter sp. CHRR-16]